MKITVGVTELTVSCFSFFPSHNKLPYVTSQLRYNVTQYLLARELLSEEKKNRTNDKRKRVCFLRVVFHVLHCNGFLIMFCIAKICVRLAS